MSTEKGKPDGGAKIIAGLDEALAWARGSGTAHITFPGQPGREMTRDEYEAEKVRLEQTKTPATAGSGRAG